VQAKEFLRKQTKDPDQIPKEEWEATLAKFKEETEPQFTKRWLRWEACTLSRPSGMNRGASITSSSGRADARVSPGSSRFYLSLRTICCGS